jgi:hypothetical protein
MLNGVAAAAKQSKVESVQMIFIVLSGLHNTIGFLLRGEGEEGRYDLANNGGVQVQG